jgi:hypothetical protein
VHLHKLLLPSPRSGNTHDMVTSTSNGSGQFMKPVRPLLLDLTTHGLGKPVKPVWQTGQDGFVQKLPQNTSDTQKTSRAFPPLNKRSHRTTETLLLKNSSRQPVGLDVDSVYSYQTSYVFASGQIPCRSQGTLLPSSGEPKLTNPRNNVQRKDSI